MKLPKLDCNEALSLLDAFEDNELDGVHSLAVQEHLDNCPACRRHRQWNRCVSDSLDRLRSEAPEPAPDLKKRIVALRNQGRPRPFVAHFRPAWLAAAALALLLAGGMFLLPRVVISRAPEAMEFVSDHSKMASESTPPAYATSEPADAQQWLNQRLPFEVSVPASPPSGYRLLGARACRIQDEPVGLLLYEYQGTKISCYLSGRLLKPLRGLTHTSPPGADLVQLGQCGGQRLVVWEHRDRSRVLVGDAAEESLVAFAGRDIGKP